jgi:hypothetical protein
VCGFVERLPRCQSFKAGMVLINRVEAVCDLTRPEVEIRNAASQLIWIE